MEAAEAARRRGGDARPKVAGLVEKRKVSALLLLLLKLLLKLLLRGNQGLEDAASSSAGVVVVVVVDGDKVERRCFGWGLRVGEGGSEVG